MNSGVQFKAFISYSHTDEQWARWLHKALETYRIPPRIVTSHELSSNRLTPIFRDRDELSSASDLSETIKDALESSENMIVICSQASAASLWVNEEIRYFRSLGRTRRIFPLLIDAPEHSFPKELTAPEANKDSAPRHEPLAADVRAIGDGKRAAKLKLVAALINVRLDELTQRDAHRQQRRLLTIAGSAMVGMLLMAGLAFVAVMAQREAEQQKHIAELERGRAEEEAAKAIAVNEFLQTTFASANPYTGGDRDITLLEVLQFAEPRIDVDFSSQPLIEAAVKYTVGMTYLALTELDKAKEFLQNSLDIRLKHLQKPHPDIALSYLGLAGATRELGDYEQAAEIANTALSLNERFYGKETIEVVDVLTELISIYSRAGQFDDARATADRALDLLRRYSETDLAIARGLFDRANVDAFTFEYAKAEPFAREALSIRRNKGEHDAILLDSLNQLGTITLGLGKLDEAEAYYQEAVDMSIEVLGELHLNTAIFKENLGNVWFRQKHYAKTIAQLDDVLAIRIEVVGESHEAVGRTLANLGSLNRVTGNLDAAHGYFNRALVILETTLGGDHSDIGNLTKSLGYLEAQQNNHAVAIMHFTRSKAIMAKAHGDESWQAALLDVLLGKSLLAMENKMDAKGHFERALGILERHYGSDHERTRAVVEALAGIAD